MTVFFSSMTSVLEDLGCPESAEENFDMEAFVEMMEAYVPGFADINSGEVCEMMFSLSGRLLLLELTCAKALAAEAPLATLIRRNTTAGKLLLVAERVVKAQLTHGGKGALSPHTHTCAKAWHLHAPCREKLGDSQQQGASPSLESPPPQTRNACRNSRGNFALYCCRYMMVGREEDQKTHEPAPPKGAPKKLIRCIDNQVVSTKGERYKDIRKPESEERRRTYLHLKLARKHKFH
ncbi:PREDICTED: LOW QUALITY PROTEIN: CUE domain-containing protein 2 [Gekko japonicus]|uniref:LOW QUALITY PROTEIN: CUE domain-containing protein 2 n=1 Tax=Gekko japonicus TaxID=146911 RepID=A0ABM1K1U4_GEKJA|nr:PREDICTED: LOW QUALITY PROTEIN: CUE domain-containing protein 2 [Gekko japonicus]